MDRGELFDGVLSLRRRLSDRGVRVDAVLLCGSRARGDARHDSDWDLAIVSRDFGKSRFDEGVLLNRLAFGVRRDCDLVPIGLRDYLDPAPLAPLLHEFKLNSVALL